MKGVVVPTTVNAEVANAQKPRVPAEAGCEQGGRGGRLGQQAPLRRNADAIIDRAEQAERDCATEETSESKLGLRSA